MTKEKNKAKSYTETLSDGKKDSKTAAATASARGVTLGLTMWHPQPPGSFSTRETLIAIICCRHSQTPKGCQHLALGSHCLEVSHLFCR